MHSRLWNFVGFMNASQVSYVLDGMPVSFCMVCLQVSSRSLSSWRGGSFHVNGGSLISFGMVFEFSRGCGFWRCCWFTYSFDWVGFFLELCVFVSLGDRCGGSLFGSC